jgi:hypothetical protein
MKSDVRQLVKLMKKKLSPFFTGMKKKLLLSEEKKLIKLEKSC